MRAKPSRKAVKRKPRGPKYRNLHARDGVVYYQRVCGGRRVRFSTQTNDWDVAASVRDLYEQRSGIGGAGFYGLDTPSFADMADRYLAEATGHLAPTTRDDRRRLLGESGPIQPLLGREPLDVIGRRDLHEFWVRSVQGRRRSFSTGQVYLDAISGVLGYAVDLGILDANPVPAFRETLRRRRRSQRGRADERPGRDVSPIEQPGELRAFTVASERSGGPGRTADMLQLDAGLRLGEVLGLQWRDVQWGLGPEDLTRALEIRRSLSRGRHMGPPKSGRPRRVGLSRRLGAVLRRWHLESGRPGPSELVLPVLDPSNYRKGHFREVCSRAGLGHRRPKDLRDTFASQLLTAGVQLGYLSRQLGHATVAVTATHYARWAAGDAYRSPLQVLPGELPADLLARLEDRLRQEEIDAR